MPTPINNLTFRPTNSTPTQGVHAQHHDEIAATIAGLYSVMSYGAVGDNVTNDTAAIQAAIDAAAVTHGTVYFPPGVYKITAALQLPSGGGYLDVGAITLRGAGRNSSGIIQWTNNTSIFQSGGSGQFGQTMTFRDLRMEMLNQASTTDTQAYGIAFDGTPTDLASFTVERCWINKCYVAIGVSKTVGIAFAWNVRVSDTWLTSTRHNAIKLNSPTPVGMPSNIFEHLYIANTGVGNAGGAIVSDGAAFDFLGATVTMVDIDLEGWYNNAIRYAGNSQAMSVSGFYIEHHHFDGLNPAYAAFPFLFDLASDAVFESVIISADTTGAIGAYMFAAANCNLTLRGVATNLTIGGGGYATAIQTSGTTSRIFYAGDWRPAIGGINVPFDNTTTASNDGLVGGSRALTYSASIATDAGVASDKFRIVVTNGTAFTIATPTNPVNGKVIAYDIKNSSGGAHGVITWGAGFLNGGAGTVGTGAFAAIANTKRRVIRFYYDGTNWVELSRTADQ